MKALNSIIGALVVASATAFSAPSAAAMVTRIAINHGATGCQGTTPTFQSMLRYRTEGFSNSSQKNPAMVVCGGVATPFNQNGANGGDVWAYGTAINNLDNKPMTVNCSLVDSLYTFTWDVVTVYPKSVTIPVGGIGYIDWWASGTNFAVPSMTCQLPPNAEISYTVIMYAEDVGL